MVVVILQLGIVIVADDESENTVMVRGATTAAVPKLSHIEEASTIAFSEITTKRGKNQD